MLLLSAAAVRLGAHPTSGATVRPALLPYWQWQVAAQFQWVYFICHLIGHIFPWAFNCSRKRRLKTAGRKGKKREIIDRTSIKKGLFMISYRLTFHTAGWRYLPNCSWLGWPLMVTCVLSWRTKKRLRYSSYSGACPPRPSATNASTPRAPCPMPILR